MNGVLAGHWARSASKQCQVNGFAVVRASMWLRHVLWPAAAGTLAHTHTHSSNLYITAYGKTFGMGIFPASFQRLKKVPCVER